ncbi:putative trans-sialidase, Group VII [Trypanosoma cruzi]|uniref:Putative trans-sialidase, Group VII n=1 Tax=Trypanosoma cruzi TaxID=5693 RepID=A0A2V2UFH4_TRYCR|nr:putative trans-sialidase, Group VII [Trypanosoma cruzi]
MLSRVAADKAPRTHNRRRVTGSSGRRREGGESERQRPNMSRHVFTSAVLLLVVMMMMMCCGTGGAAAVEQSRAAVDFFKGTTPISFANWKDFEDGSKITSLRVPGLVKVGDDVFAVAEARCGEKDGADSCAGIVSKHLNIIDGPMDILTSDISLFCMQLGDTAENSFATTELLRPTTLVIGDSVYVLLGNYCHTKQQVEGTNERGLLLLKGTVFDEGGNNKKIRWNETLVVKPEPKGESHSLTKLIGGGGSGAVMGDGKLVFPMQAKNKDGASVLLSMSFTSSKNKWQLSSETPGNGCRDPTLVKWKEDEILFMMAHCAGGYYDVYRSTPQGVSWYKLGEAINRVWGNSRDRKGDGVQSGSTTAIIEEKEVMLITAPVYSKENDNGKGRLHLWVTDNARVHDVGPVSREDDDAAASSLLVKSEEELILLYERKNGDGPYSLVAMRLTEQLERIKSAVKKWKELDSALRVPTGGLVGFLSSTLDGTAWKDEYLGVNAAVRGGVTSTESGAALKGAEAQWPVGDMGQTVPYYFTNNKFTLSATVTIHEVPEAGSIPLIGARLNDKDNTVLFQLSYTSERTWNLTLHKMEFLVKPSNDVGNWETNTAIRVTVQKNNDDEWFVYANGRTIYETDENELSDDELVQLDKTDQFGPHRISHFFFGAGSKKDEGGSHVTVADVLLYNRILYHGELRNLNARTVPIRHPAAEELHTAVEVTGTEEEKWKATQLATSLADVEEAPIAQPADSRSVRVLAGSEPNAENVTDELSPRTAATNDTSVPETNHSASDGSMGPEDRLALITDAKLILHDLSGDSTACVRVSRALLLLLGLCALVAFF